MTCHVVVVGDVMLDVVVRPTEPVALTSDTPSQVHVARGGSGANVAVALRARGPEVTFVGACGRDDAAAMFVTSMRRANVEVQLEYVATPTGTVVALVDKSGQRAMLTERGGNAELSRTFVAAHLNEPLDHVHVSGYVFLEVATRDLGIAVLSRARELGASTSVDACSLAPLRVATPAAFLAAAAGADTLFANEEEALALSRTSSLDDALDELATKFKEVVVTAGARGAYGVCGAQRFCAGAVSVEVIDTTGAGDAATGTYLGARLLGAERPVALEEAMIAAARVVGGLGARG